MKNPIPPLFAVQAAEAVYRIQYSANLQEAFGAIRLNNSDHFDLVCDQPGAAQRFAARAGAFEFKAKTGSTAMAMGRKGKDFEGEAVLLCRGTNAAAPYDWLTDANYALTLGPSGSSVHAGFHRTFKDLQPGFSQFLAMHAPRRVHCIGHSLGGALATLSADWLSSIGVPASLYTFGSPRVGTEAFAQNLTRKVGAENIYRVLHSSDLVSMVPVWPYLHVPRPEGECWISRSTGIQITTYMISTYLDSLKKGPTWDDLRFPTPSTALDYGYRAMTAESLLDLLVTSPLLGFCAAVKLICKPVAVVFLPGMSILDQLSIWVERASDVSIESGKSTRMVLQVMAKVLGMALVIPQKIGHEIVRTIFHFWLWARYREAEHATAIVASGA